MEIEQYVAKKKIIHQKLISYLESDDDIEEECQNLLLAIRNQQINDDPIELKEFFLMIIKFTNFYYRKRNFFEKIERIIMCFRSEIEKNYTNSEIFEIFSGNKRVLLFITESNIFKFDKQHALQLMNKKFSYESYCCYFYFYIKPFIDSKKQNSILAFMKSDKDYESDSFADNQKEAENETYICKIIRNDDFPEFIKYTNQEEMSFSEKVRPSIFESNKVLLQRSPYLIEYAAFFGSFQIFKFLHLNEIDLSSTLWGYAIHSQNFDIIHILEENNVEPPDYSFKDCVIDAIKCHNCEIKDYLHEKKIKSYTKFDEDFKIASLKYRNYQYFPTDFNNYKLFYYLCKYNYIVLVRLLLKTTDLASSINKLIILMKIFF